MDLKGEEFLSKKEKRSVYKNKDILNFLENITRESEIFKRREKYEFFLKTEENTNLINEIDSLIKEDKSFLLAGPKASGKSYLIRESLLNREYLYINLENIYRIFSLSERKRDEFISFINSYDLLVLDEYRLGEKKHKYYRLIRKIIHSRKLEDRKIIVISSEKHSELKDIHSSLENLLILNPPRKEFINLLIKEIIKREFPELKIIDSALSFLSLILGNNLKELLDKLFKLIFFLKSFGYNNKILELDDLVLFFNDLFMKKEREKLINYENNSQLDSLCIQRNFEKEEVKSKLRTRKVVFVRDQIIFILKKKLNYSVKDISKILLKSESGINYSIKKIERKMKNDNFRDYFDYLTKI